MAGHVLLIDDQAVVLATAGSALRAAGIEVVATSQTVGIARHLRGCDLVLLDYHMPGLDGREVLRSLREAAAGLEERPDFYLFTSDLAAARDYAASGFDGAIANKGDDEHLVLQVHAAIRGRRLRNLRGSKAPPSRR
jgi:CheY-like chemotaxis protein